MWIVAALTFGYGVVLAIRMRETLASRKPQGELFDR